MYSRASCSVSSSTAASSEKVTCLYFFHTRGKEHCSTSKPSTGLLLLPLMARTFMWLKSTQGTDTESNLGIVLESGGEWGTQKQSCAKLWTITSWKCKGPSNAYWLQCDMPCFVRSLIATMCSSYFVILVILFALTRQIYRCWSGFLASFVPCTFVPVSYIHFLTMQVRGPTRYRLRCVHFVVLLGWMDHWCSEWPMEISLQKQCNSCHGFLFSKGRMLKFSMWKAEHWETWCLLSAVQWGWPLLSLWWWLMSWVQKERA